jgi:hypothetical protein
MSAYLGVYSDTVATTRVGAALEKVDNTHLLSRSGEGPTTDRHTFSNRTLAESELNVAKIRLVSTISKKAVDADMKGKAYVGFILTEVQESHNEKVELVSLPGDSFASYFYGGSPRQFNFSGVLLNTEQDKWRDSFEVLYEKYLRGSKSSRNFNIVQIRYGRRIVSGWLVSMSQQQSSQSDLYAQFAFSVLVSRIDMVGGTQDFKSYLIDEASAFDKANISTDYQVLDANNYNAMMDPIRTGTVIPPKRPRGGGGRKGNGSCFFKEPKTSTGVDNPGLATISDHINDADGCTVFGALKHLDAKIANQAKKAKELAKTPSKGTAAERTKIKKVQDKLNKLMKYRQTKLGNKAVKKALNQATEYHLLDKVRTEATEGTEDKNVTSLANVSEATWESNKGNHDGKVTGQGTVTFTDDGGSRKVTLEVPHDDKFQATVDDNTVKSENDSVARKAFIDLHNATSRSTKKAQANAKKKADETEAKQLASKKKNNIFDGKKTS